MPRASMHRRIRHAAAAIKVCATHAPSNLISLAWTRVHSTQVAALHMHCNSIKRPEQTSVCCVAFLTLLPIHLSHPLRPFIDLIWTTFIPALAAYSHPQAEGIAINPPIGACNVMSSCHHHAMSSSYTNTSPTMLSHQL
jgi:hypothetical protein